MDTTKLPPVPLLPGQSAEPARLVMWARIKASLQFTIFKELMFWAIIILLYSIPGNMFSAKDTIVNILAVPVLVLLIAVAVARIVGYFKKLPSNGSFEMALNTKRAEKARKLTPTEHLELAHLIRRVDILEQHIPHLSGAIKEVQILLENINKTANLVAKNNQSKP